MKKKSLTQKHLETISVFSQCDMKERRAAASLGINRNALRCRLRTITKHSGLNPKCFYDLCELVDLIESRHPPTT